MCCFDNTFNMYDFIGIFSFTVPVSDILVSRIMIGSVRNYPYFERNEI